MHVVTCTVAIGGDLNNRLVKPNVTAAELALLQVLHGFDSITDVKVTGRKRLDQKAERERLQVAYPSHHKAISELWRDNGGKFSVDVRDLKLKTSQLARDENLDGESAYKDDPADDVPDHVEPTPSVSRGAKRRDLAELG